MPEDLPIYSEPTLRSGRQFADLAKLKIPDPAPAWKKADRILAGMEGATGVAEARLVLSELSRDSLIRAHGALFSGRAGAGALRTTALAPLYRGQDCAPPEFIERSLDNLLSWVTAESFGQIHAIERVALAMTRILDVWPFEFGNLTTAIVFANSFLGAAGLTPFYIQPRNMQEFEKIIAQAMSIETQPLVNAITTTVRREMESLAKSQA
jgi:fido (protein-threonine AMPylation protein)